MQSSTPDNLQSDTLDGDGSEPPSHPPGQQHDFRLEPSGRHLDLRPRNGALLAKASSIEPGFAGCSTAGYKKAPLHLNGLPVGAYICVRTHQGRYAQLRLDAPIQPGANRGVFTYTTWDR